MSWITIERRKLGGTQLPENIIRVTPKRVTIASNICERFQASRITGTNGREKVSLGLAVDPDSQSLQLIPNSVNGFAFSTPPNGYAMNVNMPKAMKELMAAGKITTGDYRLTSDKELVFSRAR